MVVLQQQPELLEVVVAEQIGPRQRRLESAGAGDEAVAQPRIGTRDGVGVHAHEGVAGPDARQRVRLACALGERFAADEALQCIAQVSHAAVVDGAHLG